MGSGQSWAWLTTHSLVVAKGQIWALQHTRLVHGRDIICDLWF